MKKMNATAVLSAAAQLHTLLEFYPMERHLGEALQSIYLSLQEALQAT